LNNDVNDNTLYEIFSQVGQVASIRICRDAVSRRSLGYAYVNFHSVADAERALDTLNFSPIKGRPCRVMWSQRDPSVRKSGVGNVFIKNLEKSIDNKQLYDTFSMFGNILSAKIAHSPLDGQSLGYGFVHFDTDEAALKAIAQVNGMEIKERNIVVVPFKPKSDPSRAPVKSTNVYVKNIPDELNSKEKLDAMFSEFGTITNSVLSASSGSDGTSRPFAFVNFQTAEQASAVRYPSSLYRFFFFVLCWCAVSTVCEAARVDLNDDKKVLTD
jgi:polyadenylate-binding protein